MHYLLSGGGQRTLTWCFSIVSFEILWVFLALSLSELLNLWPRRPIKPGNEEGGGEGGSTLNLRSSSKFYQFQKKGFLIYACGADEPWFGSSIHVLSSVKKLKQDGTNLEWKFW